MTKHPRSLSKLNTKYSNTHSAHQTSHGQQKQGGFKHQHFKINNNIISNIFSYINYQLSPELITTEIRDTRLNQEKSCFKVSSTITGKITGIWNTTNTRESDQASKSPLIRFIKEKHPTSQ